MGLLSIASTHAQCALTQYTNLIQSEQPSAGFFFSDDEDDDDDDW